MSREHYYRTLFRTAAIWSLLISLAYFVGDTLNEPLLRTHLPRAEPRVILDMAVVPTFLFAFAYWWVARDLKRNHAIVAVAAAGSMLAFVSFATRAWLGDIPATLLPAAMIDLVFGCLFLEFLFWVRRDPSTRAA